MTSSVKKTSAALSALALGWALAPSPVFADETPKLERVAATVLGVADLESSVEFYTSALGMSVVRTTTTDAYEETILATADKDGTKVVLYQSLGETDEPLPSSRVVFYTKDAASLVDGCRAEGLEVVRDATPVAEGSPVRIGIVKDADGNTLEFIQRG